LTADFTDYPMIIKKELLLKNYLFFNVMIVALF